MHWGQNLSVDVSYDSESKDSAIPMLAPIRPEVADILTSFTINFLLKLSEESAQKDILAFLLPLTPETRQNHVDEWKAWHCPSTLCQSFFRSRYVRLHQSGSFSKELGSNCSDSGVGVLRRNVDGFWTHPDQRSYQPVFVDVGESEFRQGLHNRHFCFVLVGKGEHVSAALSNLTHQRVSGNCSLLSMPGVAVRGDLLDH